MGATIQQAEDFMRDTAAKDTSSLFMFDENDNELLGNRIKETQGDFEITQHMLDQKNATVTMNRPATETDSFGGTFVGDELKTFAQSQWKELRMVSGPDQKVYIFRTTRDDADRQALLSWANSRANIFKNNYKNAYKSRYEKAIKAGKSEAAAKKIARQHAMGMYDRNLKKEIKNKLGSAGFEYISNASASHDVNRNGTRSRTYKPTSRFSNS